MTEIIESKSGKYYKVRSRRPVRDTVICEDDILNLRIALETSKTLEEFLSRV